MKRILEDFLLLLHNRLDPHSRAKQIDDTIVVFFEKLSKQPLKFILEIIKNYVIKNIGKNFLRFELFFMLVTQKYISYIRFRNMKTSQRPRVFVFQTEGSSNGNPSFY